MFLDRVSKDTRLMAFLYLMQRGQRNERVQFIDRAARSANQIGKRKETVQRRI